MNRVIEQSMILTFDEIRILFHSMGVKKMQGVYMPEKEFTEKDVIIAMHHMSETGMIIAEEERFVIKKEVKETLEIMSDPEYTDIWQPFEEGPSYFIYWKAERVVVSEKYWRKKEAIKLSIFQKQEFDEWREAYLNDYTRS